MTPRGRIMNRRSAPSDDDDDDEAANNSVKNSSDLLNSAQTNDPHEKDREPSRRPPQIVVCSLTRSIKLTAGVSYHQLIPLSNQHREPFKSSSPRLRPSHWDSGLEELQSLSNPPEPYLHAYPRTVTMRVLWLSCLLIGTVTCGPLGKGYRSNSADTSFIQQPASSGYGFSGPGVSSDPGSSSPLPSLPNLSSGTAAAPPALHYPTFNTGYSSYGGSPNAYNSPTNMGEAYYGGYANFRDDNRPTGVDHGAFYGGYHSGVYGYGDSYGNVGSSYDENRGSESATGYGAGEENPEPVFSDVSDLEPVYSFSSRSRYQRGSAVFAQTRYSPGEFYPPEQEYAPAKAQTKGGF